MITTVCTRPVVGSLIAGLLIVGLPALPALAASEPPVFAVGVDYAVPDQALIANGDTNGDGHQDLVIAAQGTPSLSLMLGAGDGTFGVPSTIVALPSQPGEVATGDLNKDGRADVVVIGEDGRMQVLLGLADGGLSAPVAYTSGAAGKGVALGDVNKDGNLDAVTTSYLVNQGDPALSVQLGNGDGTFLPAVGYPESYGVNAGWLELADMDADGDLDAVTGATVNGILTWPNMGDGTFDDPAWLPTGGTVRDLALADLNGDDTPDVAFTQLANGNGFPRVALNDGTGLFNPPQTVDGGITTFGVSLGDLNRDGKQDLVTSLQAGGIDVFTGDGAGAFGAPLTLATPTDAKTQVVADLNGDGDLDIAGVNDPAVTVILNAAPPTLTSVAPASGTVAGGSLITLRGTGFRPNTTVTVGGRPATGVSLINGTTLSAVTPAGVAGPSDVTVTRPDSKSATLTNAFTYTVPVTPPPPPPPPTPPVPPEPTPDPTPSPVLRKQRPLVPLNLPKRLRNAGVTRLLKVPVRTNADQVARVRVTGRISTIQGEVRAFRTFRRDGNVWVEVSGAQAIRVRVRVHAPKVPGFTAFTATKVYRTTAVR